MDIRSGSGKSIGFDDEEQDYILDDFRACAAKLEKLNRRIVRFHRDSGLMAVIERKQETTSASIEEPEGNSNNDS